MLWKLCCALLATGGAFAQSLIPAEALTAEAVSSPLRKAIDDAVNIVKPALVRIHVVETYYSDGRELKTVVSGSGVVISDEGHVITNHHVAGHATQLTCTFADKEEIEAELVGSDAMTDIAILKLLPQDGRRFPVVRFGDSSKVRVGDHVLAMGSPLALAQSVTLGIVSITDMILPEADRRRGGLQQDGEDVGSLVRWIGHDAAIYPGNSGGPLINLDGDIIGINEIGIGLSGAIPGNLAEEVAKSLILTGSVPRAWLGVDIQPRLKHSGGEAGVLVAGVLDDSPAEKAGIQSGDLLVRVGDQPVDVRFDAQLPEFNRIASALEIGTPVTISVQRGDETLDVQLTPELRQPYEPKQHEFKQWGITVRNLSFYMAKELKRDNADALFVTSVGTGGPGGSAKPELRPQDVIVSVGGKPVTNVEALREITAALTEGADDPVPVLVEFERKTQKLITVIEVGIEDIPSPSLEVKKAWLPVDTQVITRDLATLLGNPEMTGFRITKVYSGSSAETAGLQVGDFIHGVDGEKMTASALEHYEELEAYIRQYRGGDTAVLNISREGEAQDIEVELIRAPKQAREMNKYRNDEFEFTVRDITFFDKAEEQWVEEQPGVLAEQVKRGGWASLGGLEDGMLILEVDGNTVNGVRQMETEMTRVASARPKAVVLKVLRGIHTAFIELEPKWDAR